MKPETFRVTMLLCAVTITSPAQNLTTLANFGSNGSLVQGFDGNLYGTAPGGGTIGAGSVFKITTAGVVTTLHSFNAIDGDLPLAGLLQATDGNFYGSTQYGGSYGTIFKITPAGALTNLHNFINTDGSGPVAPMIQATDGNLYGTTQYGGTAGFGTIFKLDLSGALTTLYNFTGKADGGAPYAALLQAGDGNFYGTTPQNGANNYGTIFNLNYAQDAPPAR